jgi:hypothetical chaperone protein
MKPYAAIDFGTSNSAICVGIGNDVRQVPLEHGRETMPTALFFNAEDRTTTFGRQAVEQYQTGWEGRLMRSLKSLLGSDLMGETTLVNGRPLPYTDIIGLFLSHLKESAEAHMGEPLARVVLGRPVHFVDEDPARDAQAEQTMRDIAMAVGFEDVRFQYEPIAAALDYEAGLGADELVLVVDIGGGTSDFSVIRLGPELSRKTDRSAEVLASSGVHIAGTDFDRALSLATVMPHFGFGTFGRDGKAVPSHVFFELATWHRINFLYSWKALAGVEELRGCYRDTALHDRLMKVLRKRDGHRLAALVEGTKVAVADGGESRIPLDFIDAGLSIAVSAEALTASIENGVAQIVTTGVQAVHAAGLSEEQISTVYFTGGSTGIRLLRELTIRAFPKAKVALGEKFSSVARGLGLHAVKSFR